MRVHVTVYQAVAGLLPVVLWSKIPSEELSLDELTSLYPEPILCCLALTACTIIELWRPLDCTPTKGGKSSIYLAKVNKKTELDLCYDRKNKN